MLRVNVLTSIQPAGHFHRQPRAPGRMFAGLSVTIFNYFPKFPFALRCGIRAAPSWS